MRVGVPMKARAFRFVLLAVCLLASTGCPTTSGGGEGGRGGQTSAGATAEVTYPIIVEASEKSEKEAGIIDEATKHNAYLDAKCAFLDMSPALATSRPDGLGCPRAEIEGAN